MAEWRRGKTAVPSPPIIAEPLATTNYSAPPPPPNFDEDSVAAPRTQPEPVKPVFGNGATVKVNGNGNGRNGHKTIVIEVKPTGNWQHACRQSIKLAHQFEGEDGLSLQLAGQNLTMDFPEKQTLFCPELVNQLERLPGIMRVYAL